MAEAWPNTWALTWEESNITDNLLTLLDVRRRGFTQPPAWKRDPSMAALVRKRPKCCVAAKRRSVPIAGLSRCSNVRTELRLLGHPVGAGERVGGMLKLSPPSRAPPARLTSV